MRHLFIAIASVLPAIAAAQAPRATVEIDHAAGTTRLIVVDGGRADTTNLGDDPVVRLHRSIPVTIRVVNTNTALYKFSRTTEESTLPEVESLQGFSTKLTPYVPEFTAAVTRRLKNRGGGETPASEEAIAQARVALSTALGNTERSLLGVDRALFGKNGLQANLGATLLALEAMRGDTTPEAATESLRDRLGRGTACGTQRPIRLPTSELLVSSLSNLVTASGDLSTAMYETSFQGDKGWQTLFDSAKTIETRAQAVLSDFEPLVANAHRVERLLGIVANACSHWSTGPITGSMTKGKSVTVKIDPRTEPELARVAELRGASYTVSIQPLGLIRPAVAIGAVAAPRAKFPTYATQETDAGLQIYESGQKDRRFGLGGTLGFTWPGLDRRDGTGVAIWLPEILVAAGDLSGAGIGSAVSFGFLKVSGGAMWIRHSALEGARAGDVIPDASAMRIVDTYKTPKWYLSIAVFDWAPFADKIPGR